MCFACRVRARSLFAGQHGLLGIIHLSKHIMMHKMNPLLDQQVGNSPRPAASHMSAAYARVVRDVMARIASIFNGHSPNDTQHLSN